MVLKSDFQADVWEGSYRLVERVPGKARTWVVEDLPDSPETTARIREYYATAEHPYLRRGESREEAAEREIAERAERAGHRSTVTFVSRERYAEYF